VFSSISVKGTVSCESGFHKNIPIAVYDKKSIGFAGTRKYYNCRQSYTVLYVRSIQEGLSNIVKQRFR
jgi:hypothetical protein